MINKDAKILVAVSGGVDSVYMLHLLLKLGYSNLGVVNFNHQHRDESMMEQQFVRTLAENSKLVFHAAGTNVDTHCKMRNESFELVARDLRRTYFNAIIEEHEYEWLALGQHSDDQAETVLLNLFRGSGVHGLAGMLGEDEEQKIFRPLLQMSKHEIYTSAIAANLEWHEDHTNHETEHDRNWLRNEIIPQLETRRSGLKTVLNDTATRMQDMSDYIKSEAHHWFENYFLGTGYQLSANHYMVEHKVLRAEILGFIWVYCNGSRKNFNNKVVFEIEKWLSSNPEGGTKVYFGDTYLTIKHGLVTVIYDKTT